MPQETFYLDKEKKEKLIVEWAPGYKKGTVSVNDELVGEFENLQEMIRGKSFMNGMLEVKIGGKPYKFEIKYRGIHIDKSGKHPQSIVDKLSAPPLLLAFIYIGLGVIAYLVGTIGLPDLFYSVGVAALITIFTVLMWKGYLLGLIGVAFIVSVDVLLNFLVMTMSGTIGGLLWLALKIVITIFLIKNYKDVSRLNEHNRFKRELNSEF